jgi:thioredoxin-like negative regulator of GroEL
MNRSSCFFFVLLACLAVLRAQESFPLTTAEDLSNQGRHAEAAALLEDAVQSNPGDEALRFRLATSLVFDRKFSEARLIS